MSQFSRNTPRVIRREAEEMYELYEKYGTYTEVARVMERSIKTVTKWVKIIQAEQSAEQ